MIIFEATLLDQIQVNGRISKKLYEKVVLPELERLEQQLKTQNEKIEKLTKCVEFYGDSDNLFKYVKDNDLGSSGVSLNYFLHARQALKEIKE